VLSDPSHGEIRVVTEIRVVFATWMRGVYLSTQARRLFDQG
jgi:hypothetical protein